MLPLIDSSEPTAARDIISVVLLRTCAYLGFRFLRTKVAGATSTDCRASREDECTKKNDQAMGRDMDDGRGSCGGICHLYDY